MIKEKLWARKSFKIMVQLCLALILACCVAPVMAVSWLGNGDVTALGNPQAAVRGTFTRVMQNDPESLNPVNADDVYSLEVLQYVFEGLMFYNEDTNQMMPGVAESYTYDKVKNQVIFNLRKGVTWHDGKPLTSEDVKFSFDIVQTPSSRAEYRKGYLTAVRSVKTNGPRQVVFQLKGVHFLTLKSISDVETLRLLPKHIYQKKEVDPTKWVGSGAYKIIEYKIGQRIRLQRRDNWWGDQVPHLKGLFKPREIVFKIVPDVSLHMKLLEKGKLDYMPLTETEFLKPSVKELVKKKVQNLKPKTYTFIAWNLKNPLFQDKRVRQALSLMLDRKTMANKFHHGYMSLVSGPWSTKSRYADKKVSPLKYNPKKAVQLLDRAGVRVCGRWRCLSKSNTPFQFQLLYTSKNDERYFTVYQKALASIGIQLNLKLVDWSIMGKAIESRQFESLYLSWHGGDVDNDPYQIWHSDSAKAGGSNFVSYKNNQVDQWIELGRKELDSKKRARWWKKVYRQIAEDAPYTFMFSPKYFLYGHRQKVKMKRSTLRYDEGDLYWWLTSPNL